MPTIFLRWDDNNVIEQGYNIYRSLSPIDVSNPPPPIATIPRGVPRYTDDDSNLFSGIRYYYAVSAFIGDDELFSSVIEFIPTDNTIYAITGDSKIIKYYEENLSWEYTHTSSLYTIYFAKDDTLYVADTSGSVLMINPHTGDVINELKFLNRVIDIDSSPDESIITFLEYGGRVVGMRRESHYPVISELNTSSGYDVHLAMSDDSVYISVNDTYVARYSFDGTEEWRYVDINGIVNDICYFNGKVYFVHGAELSVINEDSTLDLRIDTGRGLSGLSVDRYGNIAVTGGSLISYYDNSGNKTWEHTASANIGSVTTDINGSPLYSASNDITIMSSAGDLRNTITGESNKAIAVSSRPMLPEIYEPDTIFASVSLATNISGTIEYDASAGMSAVTIDNILVYDVTTNVVEYGSADDIEGLEIDVKMTYNVTN